MYDWQTTATTKEASFSKISEKDNGNMMLGVELYWNHTDIGMTCMILDPQHPVLSLSINRVRIKKEEPWFMTDMAWYELHVIQPLIENGINVLHFSFEDFLC